jgi:uncharacterized peroxidase-related enzyme
MPRIAWVEDDAAEGQLARVYAAVRLAQGGAIPDVLRMLSLRPDFLVPIREAWMRLHFSDGALTRIQHEMIATYVAALNRCSYCVTGHSQLLRAQGERYTATAQALRDGDLERANLSVPERLLLEFVGTMTEQAYRTTDEQVQHLREVGWADAQIAEAVYEAGLFNMIVRIADAFGLEPPQEWNLGASTAS